MEQTLPIADIYFTAFASHHGLHAKIDYKNGRVTFLFPNDPLFLDLAQRFYDNEPIPISDFVSELKRIKSLMYGAKESGRNFTIAGEQDPFKGERS